MTVVRGDWTATHWWICC